MKWIDIEQQQPKEGQPVYAQDCCENEYFAQYKEGKFFRDPEFFDKKECEKEIGSKWNVPQRILFWRPRKVKRKKISKSDQIYD